MRTKSAGCLLLADRRGTVGHRRPGAGGDPVVRPFRFKTIEGVRRGTPAVEIGVIPDEIAVTLNGDGQPQRPSSAGSGSEDQRGHRTGATGTGIAILNGSDIDAGAATLPGDLPLISILARIALAVAVREDAAGKATMAEQTRHASPRTLRSVCLVETDEEPR